MAETVSITATDLGGGLVEISYEITGGSNRVRAFALDINVSDGNIIDVNNYFVGECNATERGYGIFPGGIVMEDPAIVPDVVLSDCFWPPPPCLCWGDVSSGATPAGQRDDAISLSDVFHIYNHIKLYPHTGYVGPCMFEDANGDIQPVPPE
ncbi:hypothetical protein ACFL3G_05190 [Planctomycetota bacterium]